MEIQLPLSNKNGRYYPELPVIAIHIYKSEHFNFDKINPAASYQLLISYGTVFYNMLADRLRALQMHVLRISEYRTSSRVAFHVPRK